MGTGLNANIGAGAILDLSPLGDTTFAPTAYMVAVEQIGTPDLLADAGLTWEPVLPSPRDNPAALGGEFGNTLLYEDTVITNDNLDEWLGKLGDLRTNDWGGLELPPMTPAEILKAMGVL